MPARTTELPPKQQQQTQRMLMLGMLVWFLHLTVLNALTSVACEWHWLTNTIGWMDALQFLELAISAVALVLIGAMVYICWRSWRSLQSRKPLRNPHLLEDTQEDRGALISFVAMMLNGFFFLFVIATLVPMLTITACRQI